DGANWPEELKRRITRSGILNMVCSADYFRRPWCVAEWHSFREREKMLNLFCVPNTNGLTYPIRYADGNRYPPEFGNVQCIKDFTGLNFTGGFFRDSPEYLRFDTLVQAMAKELVSRIQALPPWQPNFPVVEPAPVPPVQLVRPVL